jgi:hypothetical protein
MMESDFIKIRVDGQVYHHNLAEFFRQVADEIEFQQKQGWDGKLHSQQVMCGKHLTHWSIEKKDYAK